MKAVLTMFFCLICFFMNTSEKRVDCIERSACSTIQIKENLAFIKWLKPLKGGAPKKSVPKQQPKGNAPKGSHDKNVREGNREKHEKADGRREREQAKAEEKRENNKKKN